MPGMKYIEAKNIFLETYGFSETFEQLSADGRATAEQSSNDGLTYENRQYLCSMRYMFKKYVDSKITPMDADSKKGYKLDDLDVMAFVKSYEEVIRCKHALENPDKPREAYDGIEIAVLKDAEAFAKDLSKPLVDVWADRIRDGSYSVSDLRRRTREIANMGNEGSARTAYMIHKAMEKVAEERTVADKLKPWNWFGMIRDYFYRSELSNQMERFRERGYNLEALTEEHNSPLLDEKQAEDICKDRVEKEEELERIKQEELARERERELEEQKAREDAVKKQKFTVDEAGIDFDKTIDMQQSFAEEKSIDLNSSLNSSF